MRRKSEKRTGDQTRSKIVQKVLKFLRFKHYVQDVIPSSAGESYEAKELRDLLQRIRDFQSRFGWVPATVIFGDGPGQAAPVVKRPEPEAPKPERSPQQFFSVVEFAKIVGRHKSWVYRRIYAGTLKTTDIDGITLIPRSEVDRLLSGE